MANLKELMPHIRKAAIANGAMLVYFFSPSFLSFVAILIAILAVAFENPVETLKTSMNCNEDCCVEKCGNQWFEKFKKLTILQQLIALTLLKLALNFTWLLPNWVLVLLATEMFSAWGFLKEFGIIEMGKKYVELAQKSIQKVVNMIPRYQAK